MTKPEGKPLPDPKIHKRCAYKGCREGRFYPNAIFMENYCWNHLPKKRKESYKKRLEAHVKRSRFLEEADLLQVNLNGADLNGANLKNADLIEAQLQGAKLWRADLRKADLVNANLKGADFVYAKLKGSRLEGVLWEGARYLTWKQIEIVGEEIISDWGSARDAYRRLKNYFHQQGQYGDESKAYYREKLMAKHQAHEELFGESTRIQLRRTRKSWERLYVCFEKILKTSFQKISKFFSPNKHKGVRRRWLGLWLLWAVAGFGERWMRIIPWVAGILLFFTGLFFLGSNLGWGAPYDHPTLLSIGNLFDCFVFSVVTFVTLGFGAIWTQAWLAKLLIILEAALGFVFLGMFVVLIARKFGR